MKKYIGLTGAVLLGTVVAHESRINPRDERVSLLKEKLAHLEQDIEIVKDELKSLRGVRRAVSTDDLEVQRGGFGHIITHHGGDILSGAAQLGQTGVNIYQATHQNAEPNVQGWGSVIRGGIKGAEIGHEIHDAFHHNNLEVQDYEPEVQGFGSIIRAGIKGAEIGHEIHDAFHHNNNIEVQSEYPQVEKGSLSHHIIHHGGSWVNGINDAANLGVNIYQATHHPQVESEYPEVERGGFSHVITHHGGDILSGAAQLGQTGLNIYQATHQPQVESEYPQVEKGGFRHVITHHGGDILSGAAQLGQTGLNIYQAVHKNPQVESEYYPEVERGSFGHIITHHGGDILSGAAQIGQTGVNIYNAVHNNNVMSTPYDSDEEDDEEVEEPEVQSIFRYLRPSPAGLAIDAGEAVYDHFHKKKGKHIQVESYRDEVAQRPSRRAPSHHHHTEDSDWEDEE